MVPDTKVREYHTERIGGWGGGGGAGGQSSSTVAELESPGRGLPSPSRKHLLLHHVLGADPVKSKDYQCLSKFLTEQVVLHIQPAALCGSGCTYAVSTADTAEVDVDRHLYRQTLWSSRGIQFTRAILQTSGGTRFKVRSMTEEGKQQRGPGSA